MDLLLRRLGRRPETSISDGNGDVDHLDADELSAYAENVVPAAARARYTEHLAECTRCRELIVQLSSSAGVVPAVQIARAVEPSGLRKFLASLFSPMVLRYAVPALGLILVAAVGLFVFRQKKSEEAPIAQNVEAPASTSITTTATPEPVQPTKELTNQSKEQAVAGKPAQSSGPSANQPAAAVPEAPATGSVFGETPRDAIAKKEEQQPVVSEATAPAPKPSASTDESKRPAEAEARAETPQGRYANEPPAEKTDEAAKVEDRKSTEAEMAKARSDIAAGKAQSLGVVSLQSGVANRSRAPRDDDTVEKDKKNDASETRTVAGRQFRKQGNSWIDTAYSSVRVTTNLTRGSEHYRALIADEPGIKTIAEQLDGEVVVVWKGRAYRIR